MPLRRLKRVVVFSLLGMLLFAGLAQWPRPVQGGQSSGGEITYFPIILSRFTQSATPSPTATPTPTPTKTPTPIPPPADWENVDCQLLGSLQICAAVSNGHPAKYSNVTAYARILDAGRPISAAPIQTTWYYRTSTPIENCATEADGIGRCTRGISSATSGYHVSINVRITYQNTHYAAITGFTPR